MRTVGCVDDADVLERVADDAELVADLAAEEDQGDDGDDGDESEDQCVFGKALAVVVVRILSIQDARRAVIDSPPFGMR